MTGVFGSLLSTTALPSTSAGPSDRIASTSGKFQGVITPTTPIGTRRAVEVRPGTGDVSSCSSWIRDQGGGLVELPDRRADLVLHLRRDRAGLAHHPAGDLRPVAFEQSRLRGVMTATRSAIGVAAQAR